jgi:hypothetical protein
VVKMDVKKGFIINFLSDNYAFKLKEKNKIYFRGKIIFPIENTFFHHEH